MYFRLLIIFFLLISGGCRDKKPSGAGGISGGGDCSAQSGAPGDTIHCSVADYKEGCVLFFAGRPIESSFNAATSEVEFVVPAIGGRFPVNMQCPGEGSVPVTQNFTVNIPLAGPHPVGEEPEEEAGVEPAPAEPEAEEEEEEEEPAPAPRPQPRPRAEGAPLTFVKGPNDSTALHATKLGLVRLKIRKNGNARLTQAYIYGPFNRLKNDASCGADSGHTLVVKPDGAAINPNNLVDRQRYGPMMFGEKCAEAAPADEGCYDYNAREHAYTFCRIDLEDRNETIFHTRFHAKMAPFVVVSQTEDGNFFTDRIEFEAPVPELNNARVDVGVRDAAIKVSFDYKNAANVHVENCQTAENFPAADNIGSLQAANGSLNLEHCALNRKRTAITIAVIGLGAEENVVRNLFEVRFADPQVTLEERRHECIGLMVGWPHCRANMDLAPLAARSYEVFDITDRGDQRRIARGTAPWVKSYQLQSWNNRQRRWETVATRNIQSAADATSVLTTQREHNHTRWKLEASDFDDRKFLSPGEIRRDYVPRFRLIGAPQIQCGENEIHVMFQWQGQHIQRIVSQTCDEFSVTPPSEDNYMNQGGVGEARIHFEGGRRRVCRFDVLDFHGNRVPVSIQGGEAEAGPDQGFSFEFDFGPCR